MSSFIHDVEDFLSEDEIYLIKQKVYEMKSQWKPILEYSKYEHHKNFLNDKEKMQHVLGDAIYLLHTKGESGKRDEIDWVIQKDLKSNFNWLYQKLFKTIKKTFNVSTVEFDYTLPAPGFHIFGEYEVENAQYSLHQDSGILDYYPDVDENNIRSFVSIIESPETPAHLEIVVDSNHEKINYEYGTLHFWHGMIPHRIGQFSLKKGEYRITFQGHFYVEPDTNIVKVYF